MHEIGEKLVGYASDDHPYICSTRYFPFQESEEEAENWFSMARVDGYVLSYACHLISKCNNSTK